mmetsp:Transcript_21882/g.55702  ORF Transcript_21882/g.55702 Transcript_21882/m.55702 type:complete len:434 (+) Transcript_21882:407-1708(+)
MIAGKQKRAGALSRAPRALAAARSASPSIIAPPSPAPALLKKHNSQPASHVTVLQLMRIFLVSPQRHQHQVQCRPCADRPPTTSPPTQACNAPPRQAPPLHSHKLLEAQYKGQGSRAGQKAIKARSSHAQRKAPHIMTQDRQRDAAKMDQFKPASAGHAAALHLQGGHQAVVLVLRQLPSRGRRLKRQHLLARGKAALDAGAHLGIRLARRVANRLLELTVLSFLAVAGHALLAGQVGAVHQHCLLVRGGGCRCGSGVVRGHHLHHGSGLDRGGRHGGAHHGGHGGHSRHCGLGKVHADSCHLLRGLRRLHRGRCALEHIAGGGQHGLQEGVGQVQGGHDAVVPGEHGRSGLGGRHDGRGVEGRDQAVGHVSPQDILEVEVHAVHPAIQIQVVEVLGGPGRIPAGKRGLQGGGHLGHNGHAGVDLRAQQGLCG